MARAAAVSFTRLYYRLKSEEGREAMCNGLSAKNERQKYNFKASCPIRGSFAEKIRPPWVGSSMFVFGLLN